MPSPIALLAGNAHPQMASLVAERLGISLTKVRCFSETNRETHVEIAESVRSKNVYIIQTGTKNVNNDIMELLIMTYACKTASANRVVGVVPYLPYCKQSRMRKRGAVACKLFAKMLSKAGMDHLITMDLHQKEIQGFFDFPVDNLRASPFLLSYLEERLGDDRNAVIVARNPSAVRRATSYAERLRVALAVIHGEGESDEKELGEDDGRCSPPLVDEAGHAPTSSGASATPSISSGSLSAHNTPPSLAQHLLGTSPGAVGSPPRVRQSSTSVDPYQILPSAPQKNKPRIHVVGDVAGRVAVVVDDIIDDASHFVKAADILKERGAVRVVVVATHGLLSADAPHLMARAAGIDEVVVTNTIPHDLQKMHCDKIKTVDVSQMISEAIRRIHFDESMSYLFRDISTKD